MATSRTGSSAVGRYDGQMAYVHAKRGQVLLAERWARDSKGDGKVGWVSAHPGWVDTPAVEEAYGKARLLRRRRPPRFCLSRRRPPRF